MSSAESGSYRIAPFTGGAEGATLPAMQHLHLSYTRKTISDLREHKAKGLVLLIAPGMV